ncbi:MAG: PEP/pyruvate-binding domain-containing protein, partial [Gammaproteobacteria bacterium]|nr:PEP/pyruvate-binding domain-containing protein [Gammaproteobacteria bacterium]
TVFDLLGDVEAEIIVLARAPAQAQTTSRAMLLRVAAALNQAAYGTGMLSAGETAAVAEALAGPLGASSLALAEYADTTRTLALVSTWAVGSVRYAFAEALVRYAALDPQAARFVDDLLRSSVLLPFAQVSGRLSADAQALGGVERRIFGEPAANVLALNPGLARGPLRVLDAAQMAARPLPVTRGDIVVLPEPTAELPPVAGVMTVGESNPLSHVQLLARNFGIPNLSITPDVYRRLAAHRGARVLVAAGSDGSVYVGPGDDAGGASGARPASEQEKLEVPVPELALASPIPLEDLHRGLSGRLVGPKAANLGELNRLFPGRVAPAIALPFGAFDRQTSAGDDSPRARLDRAYADFRAGRLDERGLLAELASIREAIAAMEIAEPLRAELHQMMRKVFGAPGSYGVFIRSDTNVEDLPGFTGAGLSLTLPHVVGADAQLAAVPRVWASVLSPRAIAWRGNLLEHPERVYSSVLLMRSVPADKSGVLVTADLTGRGRGLTVSTAWGVGGAVGGETTETLLLGDAGAERLISQAKAPYRRALDPRGGVTWRPADDGAVLSAAEKDRLRALADEVTERAVPATDAGGRRLPWDIEFGFVDGELTLFQIRPLVERGQARADALLATLLPQAAAAAPRVELSAPPRGGDHAR